MHSYCNDNSPEHFTCLPRHWIYQSGIQVRRSLLWILRINTWGNHVFQWLISRWVHYYIWSRCFYWCWIAIIVHRYSGSVPLNPYQHQIQTAEEHMYSVLRLGYAFIQVICKTISRLRSQNIEDHRGRQWCFCCHIFTFLDQATSVWYSTSFWRDEEKGDIPSYYRPKWFVEVEDDRIWPTSTREWHFPGLRHHLSWG